MDIGAIAIASIILGVMLAKRNGVRPVRQLLSYVAGFFLGASMVFDIANFMDLAEIAAIMRYLACLFLMLGYGIGLVLFKSSPGVSSE